MTFMVERGAGRIIALEILMSLETIIMINVYCGDTVFMFMLNDAHPMLSMSKSTMIESHRDRLRCSSGLHALQQKLLFRSIEAVD
jgi:hypothetical protein